MIKFSKLLEFADEFLKLAAKGVVSSVREAANILGVDVKASDEDVKSAYRRKVLEFHPDRNQGKDTTFDLVKINSARLFLVKFN